VIHLAGIPDNYGVYSIKHATISYLLKSGISEETINKIARYSPRSTMVSKQYEVAQDQRNVYKIIADLANRSADNKPIDPEYIDSSARFNQYYNVFKHNNDDSQVSKDSLPMIKFYESANIDLAKAEKTLINLAEKALILASPDEMLGDCNTDNYDSMDIKVNNSRDNFAEENKFNIPPNPVECNVFSYWDNKLLKHPKPVESNVFRYLGPQPSVSSNIAVDENVELIKSSLSHLSMSALNNNINNFLGSSVINSEILASSNPPSDSPVFNTPFHNDLSPSLVKQKKKKKGRPAFKEPFK
jgi:hypothetical protein